MVNEGSHELAEALITDSLSIYSCSLFLSNPWLLTACSLRQGFVQIHDDVADHCGGGEVCLVDIFGDGGFTN